MLDPYHRWLGIPRDQRPPTYYQLLGIAPDEDDPEVIQEAALRQTSHVRTYQTGPYAQQSTTLLNEIAQARATLLNPVRRKEYDARLRLEAGPPAVPSTQGAQAEVELVPISPVPLLSPRLPRANEAESCWPLGLAYAGLLLLGAALAFLLASPGAAPERTPPTKETSPKPKRRSRSGGAVGLWPRLGAPRDQGEERMKGKEVTSPEAVWLLLRRSGLLSAEEVQVVEYRWREGGAEGDVAALGRWLVANQYVTEYQMAQLLQNHADRFFLGPYKLLDRIGKGRLGMVYEAVHRLGQRVAIKVLPPSRARDPHLLARFQRQTQVLQQLDHLNVVRALGAGEDDGLHYLVLEYLDGETLQDALDRHGRLPPLQAVDFIGQVLAGLQHLHERGLVHCNLGPANLMLVRPPRGGRPSIGPPPQPTVKILDISLSRSALESEPAEGVLLGVPGFLAPEQARDAHSADIRADLYSLGCILYYALAGRPPFRDSRSPRPLRELTPDVPEELEQIVGRMMAADPVQRFQTPEEAASAFQAFVLHTVVPVLAPEPRADEPATEPAPTPPATPFSFLAPDEPGHTGPPPEQEERAPFEVAPVIVPSATARNGSPARGSKASLQRRDFLLLLLGACGLLLAQALGWLLGRLSRAAEKSAAQDQTEQGE
jgi:serine/threonine protein kinase